MKDFNLEPETRNEYFISSEKKRVWEVELDLLKKLLEVCEKYNLKCFADAGTLLGAVRHKGFIPWDDDIDMAMLREDYDKLLEISEKEFQHPYFLQTTYSDEHYVRGHAQLRNSDTTAILKDEDNTFLGNQGIFLDIFVLDGVVDDEKKLRKQKKEIIFMQKMLNKYMHGKNVKTIKSKILYFLTRIYFKFVPYRRYYKKMEDKLRKNKISECEQIAPLGFIFETTKRIRNKDIYDETIMLDFENTKIPAPYKYDEFLKKRYGNYMKPVQGPTTHGDVFFDTKKSYLEYRNK